MFGSSDAFESKIRFWIYSQNQFRASQRGACHQVSHLFILIHSSWLIILIYRFVQEALPPATLIEFFSGTISLSFLALKLICLYFRSGCCTYTLPKAGLKLSSLFMKMETEGKNAGISEWSINQSSLVQNYNYFFPRLLLR